MSMTATFEAFRRHPSDIQHHVPMLRDLVVETSARQVIELGVRSGVSTVALLAGLEQTDGRLWSCDIAGHTAPPECEASGRWTFHHGDDRLEQTLAAAPGSCDLLFIDTSHEYAHTQQELWTWGMRVRQGGVVVMHDADLDGVSVPAVRWALERGATLTVHPHDHGLVVIRLPGGGR